MSGPWQHERAFSLSDVNPTQPHPLSLGFFALGPWQHERARVLEREVEVSRHKAELITLNAEDVDAAIAAVREELASGMDWARLWQLIKEERRAGNPVAGLVHSMNLAKGKISLMLSGDLDSMDEDEKTAPVQIVSNQAVLYASARHPSTTAQSA